MMKRIISLGLALLLALSLSALPASAAGSTWRDAYTAAIRNTMKEEAKWGIIVTLVDFDGDGTPELIVSSKPGSGHFSEILYAATYQNGVLTPLSYEEGMCNGNDYTLYRNNSTGARKIEASLVYSAGLGIGYSETIESYWLSGKELCSAVSFNKVHDLYDRQRGEQLTYYVNGQQVSKSNYDSACSSRNNGWTKVQDFQVVDELYENSLPSESQLSSLFAQWKDPAPSQSSGKTVSPTAHSMTVDGAKVSPAAYTIDGNNYFKLRDIAALLTGTTAQFQVGYDAKTQAISLTTGQPYTAVGGELTALPAGDQKAVPTPSAVYVDGKQVSLTAYNINGNNYFKLRDLGQALGFYVGWNDSTRTVVVESGRQA